MPRETREKRGSGKGQGIRNPMFRRLLTLKEAAIYLGRSIYSMRELAWGGQIPVVRNKGGRKLFFDIHDLDAFIEKSKSIYE